MLIYCSIYKKYLLNALHIKVYFFIFYLFYNVFYFVFRLAKSNLKPCINYAFIYFLTIFKVECCIILICLNSPTKTRRLAFLHPGIKYLSTACIFFFSWWSFLRGMLADSLVCFVIGLQPLLRHTCATSKTFFL